MAVAKMEAVALAAVAIAVAMEMEGGVLTEDRLSHMLCDQPSSSATVAHPSGSTDQRAPRSRHMMPARSMQCNNGPAEAQSGCPHPTPPAPCFRAPPRSMVCTMTVVEARGAGLLAVATLAAVRRAAMAACTAGMWCGQPGSPATACLP